MYIPLDALTVEHLSIGLKKLSLPVMARLYEEQANRARDESLSFEEFLFSLVQLELAQKHAVRVKRLLRDSKLPLDMTMETFDRSRLPEVANRQVSGLLEGCFVDRCENVLAFGPPGVGKTHLICALGHTLVQKGYSVLYRPCSLIVEDLLTARESYRLNNLLRRLRKFDALILDDIGHVKHSAEDMEVLALLMDERERQGGILLSSSLAFQDWDTIFHDPMTSATVIDRLVHRGVILEMNIPSFRLEVARKRVIEAHSA